MIYLADISARSVTFLLFGVMVMILLSASLVVFFVVYQRRIQAQQEKQLEIERLHQRNMLTAAVEVQESERRRIASDLHDGIGSLLSATRLYLRQLKPDTTPEKALGIGESSLNILDEIIQNTRRITHDLLPPVLEKFGFHAAIEDLCDKVNGSGGIKIAHQLNCDHRLPSPQEIALYRIVQELMNNTLKHAKAKTIKIIDSCEDNKYYLNYQDDGKGFDYNENIAAGLGLRNIESRVTVLDGELNWKTSPGSGLDIKIYLPI